MKELDRRVKKAEEEFENYPDWVKEGSKFIGSADTRDVETEDSSEYFMNDGEK